MPSEKRNALESNNTGVEYAPAAAEKVISELQAKLDAAEQEKAQFRGKINALQSKLAEYERRNKVENWTFTLQKASRAHWLSNGFDDSYANAMDRFQDKIKDAVHKLRSGDIQDK